MEYFVVIQGDTAQGIPDKQPMDTLVAHILTFMNSSSVLVGDPSGDGKIDISDIFFLIDYLVSGGPAPCPFLTGDTDCSGSIDISDIMMLIDFLRGTGPQPICP